MNGEQNTEHTVAHMFGALLYDDLPIATFQQWVYTYYDLADVVGDDVYMRLLDIEYGLSSAKQDVIDAIENVPALQPERIFQSAPEWEPENLVRSRVRVVLCGLLDGTIPVISACQQLSWWRETDAPWIPMSFGGIESELGGIHSNIDNRFWNDEARVVKHGLYEAIVAYYDHARTEAEELLRTEYDEPCKQ